MPRYTINTHHNGHQWIATFDDYDGAPDSPNRSVMGKAEDEVDAIMDLLTEDGSGERSSQFRDAIKKLDKSIGPGVVLCSQGSYRVTAEDLRDRFNGLFEESKTSFSDLERLRGLVGDIVIWIEEREQKDRDKETVRKYLESLLPRAKRRDNIAAYAKRLKERGFSLREAAQIMGVSHEQVRLLLKKEKKNNVI